MGDFPQPPLFEGISAAHQNTPRTSTTAIPLNKKSKKAGSRGLRPLAGFGTASQGFNLLIFKIKKL